MSNWVPPHDECTGCRFYRRSRPNPRCSFCGAGEFFEDKSAETGVDETVLLMEDGTIERRVLKESEMMALFSKDDDNNDN